MNDELKRILSICDHTLLQPYAVFDEIRELCDDAVKYGTASVCIPLCYVKDAAEYLGDRMKVCTVIGFPHGNVTMDAKVFEAKEAVKNGAQEIDMVINIGALKAGDTGYVSREISEIRKAAEGRILKVIIETCLLSEDEKITMCKIVTETRADFIKTSTGFSTGGATFDDVRLFKEHVDENVKIKAAGGISTLDDARKFIELGADRLGTSRIVKIAKELEAENG